MVLGFRLVQPKALALPSAPVPPVASGVTNTEALGRILYTQYAYVFEAAGLILFVAMIGAIVLTLRHKEGVRRQSIAEQVARNPRTAMEVVKVPSGGAVVPETQAREKARAD
jgi:NADH-quinone oxidoreductase subunit J